MKQQINDVLEMFDEFLCSFVENGEADYEYIALMFSNIRSLKRVLDMIPNDGDGKDLTSIMTENLGGRIDFDVLKSLRDCIDAAESGKLTEDDFSVLEYKIVQKHSHHRKTKEDDKLSQ